MEKLPTIRLKPGQPSVVQVLDQRLLPFQAEMLDLHAVEDAVVAIRDMAVRGAPLIGVTAAFGMYLAALTEPDTAIDAHYLEAHARLAATRPTAVDLFAALERTKTILEKCAGKAERVQAALQLAQLMADESAAACYRIGTFGLPFIQCIAEANPGRPVQILTHCNAGYLACIDYGTATAPIYLAHEHGIPVHVWVDETRPRNQGARLTAYELAQHGVPHTLITDNAGGHLLQHGMVDMVITGSDRTTRRGDVANKIGTYLKALAAHDNGVPFYVAVPSSSIDPTMEDGIQEIEIEARNPKEVYTMEGWADGQLREIRIAPEVSPAANFSFDVTPARLVTALITERGVCPASEAGLRTLFPEWK